jgi:stage V sporulation protein B
MLIPIHAVNIYGALIGNMLAWTISIALNQRFIGGTMMKKQKTWRYMIVPGFASVIMGVFSLGVFSGLNFLIKLIYDSYLLANDLAVLFTIPFGAAVYFLVLIRSGGLKENDIKYIHV